MKNLILLIFLIKLFISNNTYSQYKLEDLFKNKKIEKKSEKIVDSEIDKKTKNCKKYSGLFNIYQDKNTGSSFIEIDTSHIGKNLFTFVTLNGF